MTLYSNPSEVIDYISTFRMVWKQVIVGVKRGHNVKFNIEYDYSKISVY